MSLWGWLQGGDGCAGVKLKWGQGVGRGGARSAWWMGRAHVLGEGSWVLLGWVPGLTLLSRALCQELSPASPSTAS